ncbi:MAG: hypothetical protein Q9200_007095 [Gallowayella weberi]
MSTFCRGYLDHRSMLSFLLARGADPQIRDVRGHRALHHAAVHGLHGAVEELIESGAVLEDRNDDETPLMMACEGHQPLLVQDLLERGGETALVRLCQRFPNNRSDTTSSTILLEHGANVNDRGSGNTPFFYALEREDLGLMDFLLRNGASIENIDNASRSALGVFCHDLVEDRDDCRVILSLLLAYTANPVYSGPGLESPLHLIATSFALQPELKQILMQLLIQAGACTKAVDIHGSTVLAAVYQSEDLSSEERTVIGRFLLNNGANVNGASAAKAPIRTHRPSPMMLELLFEFNAELNEHDMQGNTVLDEAMYREDEASVTLLRQHGARVGQRYFREVRIDVVQAKPQGSYLR